MKRCTVFIAIIIAVYQASFSQGEFLLRGQSGYDGTCGFSTDREKQSMLFSAGYSYRGIVDINLMYNRANGGSVQGGVLSPRVTFYCIKQEDVEGIPTVGITVGYSNYLSKTSSTIIVPDTMPISWHSYEQVSESTVHEVLLGLTAYRRTGRWKVFFFQPLLGARFSLSRTGGVFLLSGGLSIGTRIIRGPMIILTPRIERQSGLTSMIITLSAVF